MTLKEALNNEEIAKRLEEAGNQDAMAGILEECGIEVTEEELAALASAAGEELTDENLENVAGGINLALYKKLLTPSQLGALLQKLGLNKLRKLLHL